MGTTNREISDTQITRTKGYMTRCRDCKASKRIEVPMVQRTVYPRNNAFSNYPPYKRWEVSTVTFMRFLGENPCPCGGPKGRITDPIKGKYRADVECGPKCTGATRNVCECSCKGENHGSGH